jgi:hypothetical protein
MTKARTLIRVPVKKCSQMITVYRGGEDFGEYFQLTKQESSFWKSSGDDQVCVREHGPELTNMAGRSNVHRHQAMNK